MRPEEKVYLAYFNAKKDLLYFNEIKELSKLSDSSLTNTLKKLTAEKILLQEKTRSNTFYKIKNKKIFALKFSEISIERFSNLNRGVRVPLRNFLKLIPMKIFTVVLFGSGSKKEEKKESDIDLLVVADDNLNLDKEKKEAEITSNYPISLFQCTINQFLEGKDPIIIQSKKTGFPIHKEQNFYEAILDEYN